MTTRVIKTATDLDMLTKYLAAHARPFTVNVLKGAKRSDRQNRTQRLWLGEIAEQLDDHTAEEWRAYCKLTIGVPILREQNDKFRERYDAVVKPLTYEQKLALMTEPLDMPVTRIMTTRQKTLYLDAMHQRFAEQGVRLTDPEGM